MSNKMKNVPNFITSLRIIGTFCLLFIEPLSKGFFVIYTLCGLTDVLDGTIARTTGNVSQLGARLDSIADLLYYAVMIIRIFPVLWEVLPVQIWYYLGCVIIIRIISYTTAALRGDGFASLHTVLNKITGLFVFAIPYIISMSFAVVFCFGVVTIAAIASVHELTIHLRKNTAEEVKV